MPLGSLTPEFALGAQLWAGGGREATLLGLL